MSDTSIGIFEAKTHFSAIVEEVQQGRRYVITRHGRAVALLIPLPAPRPRPMRGSASSPDFFMAEGFDDPIAGFEEYR